MCAHQATDDIVPTPKLARPLANWRRNQKGRYTTAGISTSWKKKPIGTKETIRARGKR